MTPFDESALFELGSDEDPWQAAAWEVEEERTRRLRRQRPVRGKQRARPRARVKIARGLPLKLKLKRRLRPRLRRVQAASACPACICPAHGVEFVRWVQSRLNVLQGLNLAISGVMNPATRAALRRFQEQHGLTPDGIAGPDTEEALVAASKQGASKSAAGEPSASEEFELETTTGPRPPDPRRTHPPGHETMNSLLDQIMREAELEQDEDFEFLADDHAQDIGQEEVDRSGPDYTRWVQRSLNKVLGSGLVVDGIRGAKTRAAVRSFQKKFALAIDGIVGPQTQAMLTMLSFTTPPRASSPSSGSGTTPTASGALPRIVKHGIGYVSYGGGRLDRALQRLRAAGRLSVTDGDIETLQRLARVESSGLLACVQSYDSAYMSFGFAQFTVLWGELQDLIRRVPKAFARHGIELAGNYRFHRRSVPGIRGAPRAGDLRSRAWAERFMRAALDDDIVVAQVGKALQHVARQMARVAHALGASWSNDLATPSVRALVAETYNNRPVVLKAVLRTLPNRYAAGQGSAAFTRALAEEIRKAYANRGEAAKGQRLTTKILKP